MYAGQVPRSLPPDVRATLLERAAEMVAERRPVTVRALVEGTGASTMAVYSQFGGMPGLWRAVRQEGHTRLAERLREVKPTDDAVRDLAALGAAYASNAVRNPALYRLMFDAAADLDDPAAAGASFESLVEAAHRASTSGRFDTDVAVRAVALRYWSAGHGLILLVLTGVLPVDVLRTESPAVARALFVAAGDRPDRCAASVAEGWRTFEIV